MAENGERRFDDESVIDKKQLVGRVDEIEKRLIENNKRTKEDQRLHNSTKYNFKW